MAGGEIIFGRQPVLEVLKAGRRELFELTLAVGMKPSRELTEIRSEAAKRRVRVSERPRQSIESQVGEGNHQGVALRCGKFPYAGLADVAAGVRRDTGRALVLFLDHVQMLLGQSWLRQRQELGNKGGFGAEKLNLILAIADDRPPKESQYNQIVRNVFHS